MRHTTNILISKSKDGKRAQYVEHTTDPVTKKKTSRTKHLVYDRQVNGFVQYTKTHTASGANLNIDHVIEA
jgi:hypothetical protein